MYKKLLLALLASSAIASSIFADIARVEAGVGVWKQETSSTSITGTKTTYDKENDTYVWAFIKHPAPIIPNIRIEHVKTTSVNAWNETTEFAQIDVIPYYNILDNTGWITIDLGLDIKSISLDTVHASMNMSDDFVLPLGYLRTRFQLPLSGLGAEADAKYVSYSDNTVYDARIKLDYTFDISPVIQPAIEVGYRVQKIETDELLYTTLGKIDFDFSGFYAGVMIRF
ncbi:TIGR04219 family outer membrane beta-barrel protein [Sulfurimonas sp.]|uniref:TIGR04219 family outer membrane beta-barrel protein n=1 Tax=Sulfurimonas sp. TaxID=2022749 RepID=UPI003565A004